MSIRTIRIFEGEPFAFTERVKHQNGDDVLPLEVATITLRAYDFSRGDSREPVGCDDSIAPLSTMFTPLQLDGLWTRDDEGYNFRHDLTAWSSPEYFSGGGKTYRLEYRFGMKAGGHRLVLGRVQVSGFLSEGAG